jgi:putative heme-binding domain-containing protein
MNRTSLTLCIVTASAMALPFAPSIAQIPSDPTGSTPPFQLRSGDHICIIGNTLAERMQHYGWLETLIQSRFPKHNLVFRNLGYSGDEVAGFTEAPDNSRRLRSMDFGTSDQWLAGSAPVPQPKKLSPGAPVRENRFELTNTSADVIFAFFGYNESFAGEAGLSQFKRDLDSFIKHSQAQRYNPKSSQPARLLLFSPIAHEFIDDPNLPSREAIANANDRLQTYTTAMAQVARAHGVTFVDLLAPTAAAFHNTGDRPRTINGVHLSEQGDRMLAEIIDRSLFGAPTQNRDAQKLDMLRAAVKDKDFYWYHRYRTTDGYSTYGDRAFLSFIGGQTNYEVVQRELEALDVMTANRDRRVWTIAEMLDKPLAKLPTIDDSNVPSPIAVTTNKPGPLPGGKHEFLSGVDQISKMSIAKGMKVSLYASEEQFPELVNPVQMAIDTKGRVWVSAWPTYPHWKPGEEMNDKLLILEDTNGDGMADRCKVFADHLHNPTGFEFWNGGVIVAQAPYLVFLKDTNGDDRADTMERILGGLDTADTHHTANSFTFDPGGALYFQEGTFHHTQAETPYGPVVRLKDAGVFRYEPRTHKFETYVTYPFANPHGHVWDRWGRDIVHDGTGANPYDGALFSGRLDFPQKHNNPPQVYKQRTRPCPATEILSSRHFPDELQDTLLVANVIGVQGILVYRISDHESSLIGAEVEPLVLSSDPNFRPADIEVGADGAIYFTDWHNPIIGHMQHNLRDPNRDREHGRVYRVTCEGRPPLEPAKIAGQPIGKILDSLKEPENRTRYRARIELSGRPTREVIAALNSWISKLDKQDPDYEHHMLEALWVFQQHNVVQEELLGRMLRSSQPRARAAATRVLCYWRDRVSDSLNLLKKLAADPHPRVRLEAVRAASFFSSAEAIEVPLVAADQPMDLYLEFVRAETMRTLEPIWKKALAEGGPIPVTTEAGAKFVLRTLSVDRLLAMERTRPVCLELLHRPGILDEHRREALTSLAKFDRKSEAQLLLDTIHSIDEEKENRDDTVLFDVVRLLTSRRASELGPLRSELEQLALSAKQPIVRQVGFVALMTVDGSADSAWQLATRSVTALRDLVSATPLVADAGLRAILYPKIEPLLDGLPPQLGNGLGKSFGATGRYVRVELPGNRRTLTLAEVEVMSEGRNAGRQGKASQINVAHGGEARRAIDGNKSGNFGDGGQTHTSEATRDPWWELDLGEEVPIESIAIYNRTDGQFGKRLDGFTLKVLDAGRGEVFKQQGIPAPDGKAEFTMQPGGHAGLIRRAAMNALVSVRGQEAKSFQTLARFVRDDVERIAAIRAIQRIPQSEWPKEAAQPLLDSIVTHLRNVPVADRTSPAARDALELADTLAALLPPDRAKQVRAQLGELGVRMIRIGTIFERMAYDKDVIAVRAGKPIEFLFENTDLMPHNFVITEPGALEEIGQQAEATATDPAAAARHYVPPSSKVLLSSVLLQPRESQKLSWTAPSQAGVYPYVCTYPGHWRRMYGALYVVENLDDYLADPEAYLAAHSLPVKDDLLKDRRPRTEWRLEDLAATIEQLAPANNAVQHHLPSYTNGRHLFQIANCIACHRLEGMGNEFGPDLTKFDPKLTPIDILKDILDPSSRINEKYQSFLFETRSGRVVTGIILEETAQGVKIIENPLAKPDAVILRPSEIAERKKSPASIMPKGLLDKLTRDEILDLVAFIAARGDRDNKIFRGAGHSHAQGH